MVICSIRVTGSAAVNMCLVASGQADAYYEYGIHCWDIAAGDVIVREAGGVSMMPTGQVRKLKFPLCFILWALQVRVWM